MVQSYSAFNCVTKRLKCAKIKLVSVYYNLIEYLMKYTSI